MKIIYIFLEILLDMKYRKYKRNAKKTIEGYMDAMR